MNKTRRSFLIKETIRQRQWIDRCENNDKSYTGPNGPAIRQADNDQLRKLEKELAT